MSKLVVFDVDGTILNSWGMFDRIILDYADRHKLPAPCLKTVHRYYDEIEHHDIGWDVGSEQQLEHFKSIFAECNDVSSVSVPDMFEGTEDMLKRLKDEGNTLAIVTGKAEPPLMEMLEHHNLYTLFSAHRTWCDIERKGEKIKPAPDMLDSVMRELNFVPDETVMIGDTTMDVLMGRNAKTGTIGVTWGAHTKDVLEEARAHYIVETGVSDLVPVIGKDFTHE